MEEEKKMHRELTGVVTSDKMNKTIVVEVTRNLRHEVYGKLYKRSRKFHVHDEKEQYGVGDVVTFVECRPLSKTKKWRVVYQDQGK
ncbi:MAG: 30S ribosomal protein S17 [Candidatus Kerfeldbacteria bacterium]|nr:30S ribosomal protein S17 [Candidatus Kerfeldbacteria bacterium]